MSRLLWLLAVVALLGLAGCGSYQQEPVRASIQSVAGPLPPSMPPPPPVFEEVTQ